MRETSGDVPFYKIDTFGKEPGAFILQRVYDEYCAEYPSPKKGDVLKWRTVKGSTVERLYNNIICNTEIVVSPIEIQKQYIADFDAEQKAIAANSSLIDLMTAKIQNSLAEVWND